jgi:HK97 family phage portal protein
MACVQLIAETTSTLPLKLYRPRADGGREEAPAHPLARVLAQPNARMTGAELRELLMRSLLLHGNAYCRVSWDGRGALTGLEPLPPGAVTVLRLANGRLAYDIGLDRRRERLLADEVLHLRHMSRDGVLGRSPLTVAREALDLALAQQTYAASFYANSARPDVILTAKVPFSAEQAMEARSRWEELYRGAARAFRPALLPFDMDLKTLQPSHADQQFIETRRLSNEDICRIFNVPPPAVHILDRATFSNVAEQMRALVRLTLRPWLVRLEQALAVQLLSADARAQGFVLEHVVEGLLRGSTEERYAAYSTALQWGWMSINEIRQLENLPPIPGGDAHLQPLNMAPVGTPPPQPPAE